MSDVISREKIVEDGLIIALKVELEEIRKKKERAVGPEAYDYYWDREKKLEEKIRSISIIPAV